MPVRGMGVEIIDASKEVPADTITQSFADGAAAIESKGDAGLAAGVVDPFAEDNPANADKAQSRLEDLDYALVEHSGECYGQLTVY